MSKILHRRNFLSSMIAIPAAGMMADAALQESGKKKKEKRLGLKISLNAYSFNKSLIEGSFSVNELIDYCSNTGFDGVDLTAYYFKGYPQVPTDDSLFQIKRKAFAAGLEISGTGVRNDFTIADTAKREQEVLLVKKWIEAAAKVGAPVLRIFSGTQKNEGIAKETITDWMLKDIRTCVEYGRQHGVIIGLQNHNDFIQTAEQINKIIESINSEWLGIVLDTGSFRQYEPYSEIEKTIKHAVSWQVKEKIFIDGVEVDTDLNRLMKLIQSSNYKGYLPIETLGEGDPKIKVKEMFTRLQKAMN